MKKILVDTFVMILFSTIFGMISEILISNMTLLQSSQSRITAIPINLLTARPYSIFRDWMLNTVRGVKPNRFIDCLTDTLSFILFQVPLYAIILKLSGANPLQIITSCTSAMVFSIVLGRPYGVMLDFFRKIFKVA